MTAPLTTPGIDTEDDVALDHPWKVIVWDDPINLMSYVTFVFRKVFGYSKDKAEKLMMQVDERIAFEASGIATKKLTALNIQKHLDNFNLESQFGTYSKMHALSGGQKVKVVLASAMWMDTS